MTLTPELHKLDRIFLYLCRQQTELFYQENSSDFWNEYEALNQAIHVVSKLREELFDEFFEELK